MDFGNNSEITFLLEMPEGESFLEIDPRAGFLRARKIFDAEEQTIYDFVVIATGNSSDLKERLTSRVNCTFKVLDLNDNQPQLL